MDEFLNADGKTGGVRNTLDYLKETILTEHKTVKEVAKKNRRRYRFSSLLSVIIGTLAIFSTIFILVLPNVGLHSLLYPTETLELIFVVFLVFIVVFAFSSNIQKKWLKNRSEAELLKSLYYRALIHPLLWCRITDTTHEFHTQWKEYIAKKQEEILELGTKPFEERIKTEKIFELPPAFPDCPLNDPVASQFITYYRCHRIRGQMNYYTKKVKQFEKYQSTRNGPIIFFIVGVIAVFIHYFLSGIISIFPAYAEFLEIISIFFVFVALAAPVISTAIRTLRSSIEIGRTEVLYEAKKIALLHFDQDLKKSMIPNRELFTILWECENFLESENREWLRLMNEAEWFV